MASILVCPCGSLALGKPFTLLWEGLRRGPWNEEPRLPKDSHVAEAGSRSFSSTYILDEQRRITHLNCTFVRDPEPEPPK